MDYLAQNKEEDENKDHGPVRIRRRRLAIFLKWNTIN